jgi:hypothetical protein
MDKLPAIFAIRLFVHSVRKHCHDLSFMNSRFRALALYLLVLPFLLMPGNPSSPPQKPHGNPPKPSRPLANPVQSSTLLDEVGNLARAIPDAHIQDWKRALHTGTLPKEGAIRLHVWVGEWELAHEEPGRALWHFQQVQNMTILWR